MISELFKIDGVYRKISPRGMSRSFLEKNYREKFIAFLINQLRNHVKEQKFTCSPKDLGKKKSLSDWKEEELRKRNSERLRLHLGEHQNMNDSQQKDIEEIVRLLVDMEPFHGELELRKQALLEQSREEIKLKAHQERSGLEEQIEILQQQIIETENELQSKSIEMQILERKIFDLKGQATKFEESLNQSFDKFEYSLIERFDKAITEPTGMLAEVLANDAFLQILLGKKQRRLRVGGKIQPSNNTLTFEIKKGPSFESTAAFLTKYRSRLERVDLDESLAAWITAIVLSGQLSVFKGNMARRALTVFSNHLTYGRCFELPLSPEIISIERLLTIGQSDNATTPGILDAAILCAASHREELFILVLEGLDRAPSQYFLNTLLDWYGRGLLDTPSNNLLSQRIKILLVQHGLMIDGVLGWPPNLLLMATIHGLTDGFLMPNTVQGKIIEINVESQWKHLDIHPALIDKNTNKPTGEITAHQWNAWCEQARKQDLNIITEFITSHRKDLQPHVEKFEAVLEIFCALCVLEQCPENAVKLVQQYLLAFV
ncbi:hypothetical protein CCP3SC15_160018 [Gammaproteobacteria bacterium]